MFLSLKTRTRLIILLLFLNYVQTQYLKMEASMEAPLRNYVSICKQGQLLPGRKMEKSEKPKITLVIPMLLFQLHFTMRGFFKKLLK